jgi:hypothetical protein
MPIAFKVVINLGLRDRFRFWYWNVTLLLEDVVWIVVVLQPLLLWRRDVRTEVVQQGDVELWVRNFSRSRTSVVFAC